MFPSLAKGARWVKGPNRTINSCIAHHTSWMTETGGDTSKLKNFASCQHRPIPIYHSDKNNVPILLLFPIAPLHLMLGAGNDALKCMDVIWSETAVMSDFYKFNGYRRGNTTGGEFTGKVNIRYFYFSFTLLVNFNLQPREILDTIKTEIFRLSLFHKLIIDNDTVIS